jgi:long-chain fatty acid transport protein
MMEESVKKKITTVLLAILIAVTCGYQIATAGGFQLNEHGARALGRASAFVARSGDPSAIFFNAAGITNLPGTQVMAGVTLIMPSTTFTGPVGIASIPSTESKMESQVFTPPNLYVTHSMCNGLSFGIGVYTPYGLGTKWAEDWVGKKITTEIGMQNFYINPTVAYRLTPELSIAAGFDYAIASVTMKSKPLTPYPGDLSLKGNGTGAGFNVGVQYAPIDMISIGASYRSKVKVDMDGTAEFANVPPTLASFFPGSDVSTSISMPANYFIGVSVKPMPELELELDYQGIVWSSYDQLAITFKTHTTLPAQLGGTPAQADVVSPKNYKDTYMIRFGAEYTMGDLQLRGGYIYDHSPVEDPYVDALLPDANRNDFTVGVGYKVTESIQVDVAYMLVAFKDRTISTSSVGWNGTYKSTANLFGLDIIYKL